MSQKMSKISHDLRFFSHVQKITQISSKFDIDTTSIFPYLLRQYLRILTHPIITFFTISNFFQNISKKFSPETQWGEFNPQTPCLRLCLDKSYSLRQF